MILRSGCPYISVYSTSSRPTSGSGPHQTQHGGNAALLPSNCCHSPSVLLRCCSADQPSRAESVEADPRHTQMSVPPNTHTHRNNSVTTPGCLDSNQIQRFALVLSSALLSVSVFFTSPALSPLTPPASPDSQGNDTDITGAAEKAESSGFSRSYTSGATLGAELRRGRSRRLSSSLQVMDGSMCALWGGAAGGSHRLVFKKETVVVVTVYKGKCLSASTCLCDAVLFLSTCLNIVVFQICQN